MGKAPLSRSSCMAGLMARSHELSRAPPMKTEEGSLNHSGNPGPRVDMGQAGGWRSWGASPQNKANDVPGNAF